MLSFSLSEFRHNYSELSMAKNLSMLYQLKFAVVGVVIGTFYSLRAHQPRGSVIPVAWGTLLGSALDLVWGYNVQCAEKIKNFEDERAKLRLLRMRTASYGVRK